MTNNINLYKGDCLEVMKQIKSNSIDAIITDPPYGTTACKWDSVIDFDLMWEQLNRIIKPNGAIVLFGREPFSSFLRTSNVRMYRYDWVWEKSKATNFLFAKQMPLMAHENIMIFYKKKPTYNPQKTKGKPYNKGKEKRTEIEAVGKIGNGNLIENKNGLRNPRSVQYFVTAEREGKLHPTQKPVALMEYLIKTYTNEGETVLDFTMGSGSTGVACKNTNRDFIGIEQDEKYFKIAQERINLTLF
jgi:site-specific DNA-methyltransferase (adenine-specific)